MPGKRIDRWVSSPVPPVGGRSNNRNTQIFPPSTTGFSGELWGDDSPPEVPGGALRRTPRCFHKNQSSMAVICGVLYQERGEKMNGEWARIIAVAPAAVKVRIFNKDSGEEHAAQAIHDTLLLNKCFLS